MLSTAKDKKIFSGICLPNSDIELSHLQFADDVILFIHNNVDSVIRVEGILQCFELLSGLHINYSKSTILNNWASLLGCKVGNMAGQCIMIYSRLLGV